MYCPGTTIRPTKRLVMSSLKLPVVRRMFAAAAASTTSREGLRYSNARDKMMLLSCYWGLEGAGRSSVGKLTLSVHLNSPTNIRSSWVCT
jgi:hypothetical protein